MRITRSLPLASALLLAAPCVHGAQDDALLSTLRRTYPNTRFDAVRRSEIPGLYEVRMGNNVAYVSASQPRYFLFGHLYDASAGKDLTMNHQPPPSAPAAPAAPAPKIDIARLPLSDAIKSTRGTGAKILMVFTDPACPYCHRLDVELAKLPDTTVYNFMLPFLGEALPQAVWCAPDREVAWKAAMRGELVPAPSPPCDSPVQRNQSLAARLGIVGTPTLIFASGERIEGYVSADDIIQRDAAPRAQTTTVHKE